MPSQWREAHAQYISSVRLTLPYLRSSHHGGHLTETTLNKGREDALRIRQYNGQHLGRARFRIDTGILQLIPGRAVNSRFGLAELVRGKQTGH